MPKLPKQHPNAVLYCDLMEQVKWRIDAVRKTLDMVKRGQHYLPNLPAAEFCLLQLRFVCELIALGCVAVHTDVPQTKRLQKLWNADTIMGTFETLKPEYFPVAAKDVIHASGMKQIKDIQQGIITKNELRRNYNFFGSLLHAGTFKRRKEPKREIYDFALLEKFTWDIAKLLNIHIYKIYGDTKIVRVIMKNAADGRVWWNELDKVRQLRD